MEATTVTEPKKPGRKPKHGTPMTGAERKREHDQRKRAERSAQVADLVTPIAATVIDPTKKRKPRSDSAAASVRAMLNAAKDYPPPPRHFPLTASAIPFWNDIMRARGIDDWAEADLTIAAHLAQCQSDYVDEEALLRDEGRVIIDYLGKTTMNPRATAADVLSKRAITLMRHLRMGAQADSPRARDFVGARDLERESRKLRSEVEDEDEGLLA